MPTARKERRFLLFVLLFLGSLFFSLCKDVHAQSTAPATSPPAGGACCKAGDQYDPSTDKCIDPNTSLSTDTTCVSGQFCDIKNITCTTFSGKTLPPAITNPSPITQDTPSANVLIPIPQVDLDKTNNWFAQVQCGAGILTFVRQPDPYKAKKVLVPQPGIQFTMRNDSNQATHFQDCEFNAYGVAGVGKGDPIDIEIYTQAPGGSKIPYGKTTFGVSQLTATPVPDAPPPCTKFLTTDTGTDITKMVQKKESDRTAAEKAFLKTAEFKCVEVDTAVGAINANPAEFIQSVVGLLLSLSGGIALMLILFSGFQLISSQGNPEKIEGARETITAAIIGLVFLIFSMVILQIIGVDILRIPGITK